MLFLIIFIGYHIPVAGVGNFETIPLSYSALL